jgi:putative ABC transport system permease protein
MKSYMGLAGRYLKQQKRRSALTVLGIMLSVALISALLTMGQAVRDNALLQEIRQNGSYHFSYPQPGPGLFEKLRAHALVDQVAVSGSGSKTPLGNHFEIYTEEVNRDALDLLPIHLESGRLPASADEVALEQWAVQRLPGKPSLDQNVTLNDPDGRPHTYLLTGYLKNGKYTQTQRIAQAYTLMPSDKPNAQRYYGLYVTLKTGVDIHSHLEDFAAMGDPFETNHSVLAMMGESRDNGLNKALLVIFGTLVGLVVLSTVAVIYNAFHISVLERIRQFGLLRTVGATPRQIRNLVLREASALALIGIPLGLAAGWGGLWIALWLMIQNGFQILQVEDFRLTFHWWVIGLSIGVGIAAVYAAAWLPARKASRVSPVDAVKGAGSIVRETYRRFRIPSLLRLLGVEGRMASNNIRRNRTKFRVTTFSVIVSVMLFIVFHFFTQQIFKLTVDNTENTKIAFEIARFNTNDSNGKPAKVEDIVSPATLARIAGLPGVEHAYSRYQMPPASAIIPEDKINGDFIRKLQMGFEEADLKGVKGTVLPAQLELYDQTRLTRSAPFRSSGTLDPDVLDAEGGVVIVQTVKPYVREEKKKEIMPLARYKVGDTLTLQMGQTNDPATVRQVRISGILSQSAFDTAYQETVLTVIGTKKVMASLIDAAPADYRHDGTAMTGVQVALKDGADSEPVRVELESVVADIAGGQLINIVDQQKQDRQFAVQMKIFVYSFLTIIGVIGSLNIVNTVQTNLLLRRREIGLLQAVGMTMRQVRKMATAEGVWFGVIGSFWGLLLGVGISYFLYVQMSGIEGTPFVFPWVGAAIACVFALGVGLFSVQGPLRRMSKANLIEELREDA